MMFSEMRQAGRIIRHLKHVEHSLFQCVEDLQTARRIETDRANDWDALAHEIQRLRESLEVVADLVHNIQLEVNPPATEGK